MVSDDVLVKKYATVLSKNPDDVHATKLNPTPRIALFFPTPVCHEKSRDSEGLQLNVGA